MTTRAECTPAHWRALLSDIVRRRTPRQALDTAAEWLAALSTRLAEASPPSITRAATPPAPPPDPRRAMAAEMLHAGRVLSTIARTTGLKYPEIMAIAREEKVRVRRAGVA